jgi:hypothetical protein
VIIALQSIAGVVGFLALIVLVAWLVDDGPHKMIERRRKRRG